MNRIFSLSAKSFFIYLTILSATLLLLNFWFDKNIDQEQKKLFWVKHTNEVIMESNNFLSALIDAETGQRGYLITYCKKYLEPYESGKKRAKEHYLKLLDLTFDNQSQTKRLAKMHTLMEMKLNELKSTISDHSRAHAIQIVKSDHGKIYMDRLRNLISDFINEEKQLLAQREKAFDQVNRNNLMILKTTIYILLALMLYAIFQTLKQRDEISIINKGLSYKIEKEVEKNRIKDKQLLINARQAQMGEMISMIAHQWRQPLSAIGSLTAILRLKYLLKEDPESVREEELLKSLEQIDAYLIDMSDTIDDFRNFYKPNKDYESLSLKDVCQKALMMLKNSFVDDEIDIREEYHDEGKVNVYSNEMMQVLMNILQNAKDNLVENNIKNPYIKITTDEKKILVCNNGLMIPNELQDKIFEPYFSTKESKNGTGLGLYMSKIIIEEHHKGKFYVQSKKAATCFVIELWKDEESV